MKNFLNYDEYLNLFKLWGPADTPVSNEVYYIKQDIIETKRAFDQRVYTANFHQGLIDRCIEKVIFKNPATIVFWKDGTKTVVKCQKGDTFDPEKGLAMAICKKIMGNESNFNNQFKRIFEKKIEIKGGCKR